MLPCLPTWPLFGFADDVRPALARAQALKEPAALATIIGLGGGGPRPVGTQMTFAASEICGFLSGGCLEADLAGHAEAVLTDGDPRRLVYGEGSPWPDIRLLCGARIEILLERLVPGEPALDSLLAFGAARKPAFWTSDGARRVCHQAPDGEPPWPGAYRRTYQPRPRLVVVGSDPTALAIASLGAQSGFETSLVRPKGPPEPPPGVGPLAYRRDEPQEALTRIGLDPWTAVAIASHDSQLDHAALMAALPSPAFYVGALGARRRLEDRLAELRAGGLGEESLARLHAPIGLDIGGKAPWEVAIAVLAEITAERSRLAAAA
jgi:xanthine dehydrogenase accessory factor